MGGAAIMTAAAATLEAPDRAVMRPMRDEDHDFVLSTWLLSFSNSARALEVTPHDGSGHTRVCESCGQHRLRRVARRGSGGQWRAGALYWREQRALIERLVASSNVTVLEQDGLIDAWICRAWQRPVVHYLYVRRSERCRGLARRLCMGLESSAVEYTHWRPGIDARRLPESWRYNPFVLMGGGA